MEDPTLERHFRGHKNEVAALDFNPNGKQLVSASLDHSVMVWNFTQQMRAFRFVIFIIKIKLNYISTKRKDVLIKQKFLMIQFF